MLEDNGLKEFIDINIPKNPTIDVQDLIDQKKCVEKMRRIIVEGVRDHIVSSIHGKDTPYTMWQDLNDSFHNNIDHKKLAQNDKLQNVKMENVDSIRQCLNMVTQCRKELGSVCITVIEEDLVSLALIGLPKSLAHATLVSEIQKYLSFHLNVENDM